jgi:hypothetical protein
MHTSRIQIDEHALQIKRYVSTVRFFKLTILIRINDRKKVKKYSFRCVFSNL